MLYGDISDRLSTTTLIDSYEYGSWPASAWSGGTTGFGLTTDAGVAIDGDQYLYCDDDTTSRNIHSFPGDGLNAYPVQGDIFRTYFRFTDSIAFYGLHFGVNSADTGQYYSINHDSGQGRWELFDFGTGSLDSFDTDNTTGTAAKWYRLTITWDDGTLGGVAGDITVEVHNVTDDTAGPTLSINDTNRTSGGIGHYASPASAGNLVLMDYTHITNR